MYVRCVFIQPAVCNMLEEGRGVQHIWRKTEGHANISKMQCSPDSGNQVFRRRGKCTYIFMGVQRCIFDQHIENGRRKVECLYAYEITQVCHYLTSGVLSR